MHPRRVALVLPVALVLLLALAACGGGGGGGSGASGPAPAEIGAAVPAELDGAERRRWFMETFFLRRLGIGVTAPVAWMDEVRDEHAVAWRVRAQYYPGGVAGAGGGTRGWHNVFYDPINQWEQERYDPTWTAAQYAADPSLATPGIWGTNQHLRPSLAAGYVPWITTYNLAASYPANYAGNAVDRVVTNAAQAETMRQYFEQLKILFQRVGEFPQHPVVVHVEPDEWAHLLISDQDEPGVAWNSPLDPAGIAVRVGSCGMAEIADLPDSMIGFANAIERLRDSYAPHNALLCVSPSPWSPDGRLSAAHWVDALSAMGCTDWELAVCETGSADLGWNDVDPPYGDATGMAGGIDRVIEWAGEIHAGTGLPFALWQIPCGNTVYRSCNNSDFHYTHNSAQLLLGNYPANDRLERFAAAGGVLLVFSGGQETSTTPYDRAKDGITNPAPIPGNQGVVSPYADDDGGYIRLRASDYYRRPIGLDPADYYRPSAGG